ncbi:MAG: pantoate--beta-alanine ligase [Rikenellaceae bacterium]
MKVIENVAELGSELAKYGSQSVGFVPTMGAIHSGHLSLVERARTECDVVVVSIFVNPTQFNDKSDLKNYPRQVAQDCELIESVGADIVFVPTVEQIYPEPDTRVFDFGEIDKGMEGATRPGHFNGVAQVVSRLFDIVKPTKSYFGEKDFQQVAVIFEMVKQLSLPVEIVVVPIVREADGVAMSSRNALLTAEHRAAAPDIYKALSWAQGAQGAQEAQKAQRAQTEITPEQMRAEVIKRIEQSGLLKVIYFEMVDARTLNPINSWEDSDNIQGCVALQAGAIRLIDNIKLK